MSLYGLIVAILCLAVLIFWHELGHFLAARWCGVYVERFSVGFGKTLLKWRDRRGTEYCLAALPLGGYVRMYGEDTPAQGSHSQVPENAKSFGSIRLWQKLLIVLAGPAFNVLLTWLVLSLLNFQGTAGLLSYIDTPAQATPAAEQLQRGDRIVMVDGKTTTSWKEIEFALIDRIGHSGKIQLGVERSTSLLRIEMPIDKWLQDVHQPQPSASLGLIPWQPVTPPIIAQVMDDTPASRAGLELGDKITMVDQQPIGEWKDFVTLVQRSPGELLQLEIERKGGQVKLTLIPDMLPITQQPEQYRGYAGVAVQPVAYPQDKIFILKPGIIGSIIKGAEDSYSMIRLIGVSLSKLVMGEIAFSNLSGPVGIVQYVGASAETGFTTLMTFVAYMSMSLGLLNLLPIPMLDGGQALLILGEGIVGRPLGEIWRGLLMRFSMLLLLLLMLVTTFNDLIRLW